MKKYFREYHQSSVPKTWYYCGFTMYIFNMFSLHLIFLGENAFKTNLAEFHKTC